MHACLHTLLACVREALIQITAQPHLNLQLNVQLWAMFLVLVLLMLAVLLQ